MTLKGTCRMIRWHVQASHNDKVVAESTAVRAISSRFTTLACIFECFKVVTESTASVLTFLHPIGTSLHHIVKKVIIEGAESIAGIT